MSMKTRFTNIIAAALVVITGAFASSCQKEAAESDAVPVVRFVRSVEPATLDMLYTEVPMGATVAIIGDNLAGVCKVMFNDKACLLNPNYVTNTSIIVDVPNSMPGEITNKLYVETKAGKSCDYPIAVTIPAPQITSISSNYAPVGADFTLEGKYFFLMDDGLVDVVFPGGVEAEVTSATETKVVCKVPDGAFLEGAISLTSKYGTGRSTDIWRTSEGIFDNFATSANLTWDCGGVGNENGCDGQYLYLTGSLASWAWPANSLQLFWLNPTGAPLVTEGNFTDYALQFEYCCDDWGTNCPLVIWFSPDATHDIDDTNAKCHWCLNTEGYVPGQWGTKTIKLADFNTGKTGEEEYALTGLANLVNLHMLAFGACDGTGELKLKIDNLRIVPAK